MAGFHCTSEYFASCLSNKETTEGGFILLEVESEVR